MRFHRLLPFATLCTLALTTIVTPQAQSQSAESSLPYVYSTYSFPPAYRGNFSRRHTIRLAIPNNSQPVSALKVTAPDGFTLNQEVEVFNNKTGEKLPVDVNVNRQTVELSFNRPIESGSAIDVELNYVKMWGTGRHYDLAVKFVSDNKNASNGKLQVSNERYIHLGRTDLR